MLQVGNLPHLTVIDGLALVIQPWDLLQTSNALLTETDADHLQHSGEWASRVQTPGKCL